MQHRRRRWRAWSKWTSSSWPPRWAREARDSSTVLSARRADVHAAAGVPSVPVAASPCREGHEARPVWKDEVRVRGHGHLLVLVAVDDGDGPAERLAVDLDERIAAIGSSEPSDDVPYTTTVRQRPPRSTTGAACAERAP